MRIIKLCVAVILLIQVGATACSSPPSQNAAPPVRQSTPRPSQSAPPLSKDGLYKGKGKVTKINSQAPSVELDHEDIPGLMPAMLMEFYVTDKSLLDNIKVGDMSWG